MFLIGILCSLVLAQDYPPNYTPAITALANIHKTYHVIFTHDLPADNYAPQVLILSI